ncbi:hypothetical protein ACE6H2_011333 [Prunus campanulata]
MAQSGVLPVAMGTFIIQPTTVSQSVVDISVLNKVTCGPHICFPTYLRLRREANINFLLSVSWVRPKPINNLKRMMVFFLLVVLSTQAPKCFVAPLFHQSQNALDSYVNLTVFT